MAKIILFGALVAAVWWLWNNRGKTRIAEKPDVREAARLLGVSVDADRDTILAAHRNLIERVHPDSGGSQPLAANVNRARDTMLAAMEKNGK